jgi:hypothetical protein
LDYGGGMTILRRAFEIAQSGMATSIYEVVVLLRQEGLETGYGLFSNVSIRTELRALLN